LQIIRSAQAGYQVLNLSRRQRRWIANEERVGKANRRRADCIEERESALWCDAIGPAPQALLDPERMRNTHIRANDASRLTGE
jgi:hypothetical protein